MQEDTTDLLCSVRECRRDGKEATSCVSGAHESTRNPSPRLTFTHESSAPKTLPNPTATAAAGGVLCSTCGKRSIKEYQMHASSLGLLYFSFISKRNQTHQEASNRSKPSPLSWPVIFLILHLDNPTNIQSLSPSLPPSLLHTAHSVSASLSTQ